LDTQGYGGIVVVVVVVVVVVAVAVAVVVVGHHDEMRSR
jgi:hypothetical protein